MTDSLKAEVERRMREHAFGYLASPGEDRYGVQLDRAVTVAVEMIEKGQSEIDKAWTIADDFKKRAEAAEKRADENFASYERIKAKYSAAERDAANARASAIEWKAIAKAAQEERDSDGAQLDVCRLALGVVTKGRDEARKALAAHHENRRRYGECECGVCGQTWTPAPEEKA